MGRHISAPFSVDINILELYIKAIEKAGEKSISKPVQSFLEWYIENPDKYKKIIENKKGDD